MSKETSRRDLLKLLKWTSVGIAGAVVNDAIVEATGVNIGAALVNGAQELNVRGADMLANEKKDIILKMDGVGNGAYGILNDKDVPFARISRKEGDGGFNLSMSGFDDFNLKPDSRGGVDFGEVAIRRSGLSELVDTAFIHGADQVVFQHYEGSLDPISAGPDSFLGDYFDKLHLPKLSIAVIAFTGDVDSTVYGYAPSYTNLDRMETAALSPVTVTEIK